MYKKVFDVLSLIHEFIIFKILPLPYTLFTKIKFISLGVNFKKNFKTWGKINIRRFPFSTIFIRE